MRFSSSTGLAVTGLALFASAALGQQAAPGAAAPFSKKVGDWTVNCITAPSANPCQMVQGRAEKSTGQQLLSISFVYVPASDQNGMIIAVPLGVSIPRGLILKTDSFTSNKLPYDHCDANGCYAELPIPKDTLQSMGKAANAQVIIAGDDGKVIPIGLSLNGFTEAHDAMETEAKAKATTPSPAVINGAK